MNFIKEEMFNSVLVNIRDKMIKEEGYRTDVYKDTLGFPTVGIGHLVLPEDNLKVGDVISKKRVDELFKKDITWAINAAMDQAKEIGEFEKDFVIALTSVNFQLGPKWPSKWPNTYKALKEGNYHDVIKKLEGSLWARQTPTRVSSFVKAIIKEIGEDNKGESLKYFV